MADRPAIKTEVLPIEFLDELTSRLRDEIELITIRKDVRIVAVGCNIHTKASYHAMYGGLDYHLNREFDLYFDLIYVMLNCALTKGVSRVEVGLGATLSRPSASFRLRVRSRPRTAHVAHRSRGRAPSDCAQACRPLV
jgi:predicted N-acyltransferase